MKDLLHWVQMTLAQSAVSLENTWTQQMIVIYNHTVTWADKILILQNTL